MRNLEAESIRSRAESGLRVCVCKIPCCQPDVVCIAAPDLRPLFQHVVAQYENYICFDVCF